MYTIRNLNKAVVFSSCASVMLFGLYSAFAQDIPVEQPENEAQVYGSVSMGILQFEGDQALDPGFISTLRLGYDFNDRWTFETALGLSPSLSAAGGTKYPNQKDVSRIAILFDGLFHFTRWERLDPYLAAGLGLAHYSDDVGDGDGNDVLIRGGGGVMYHFNDEWSVRADYRGMLAGFGNSPNANSILDAGVIWRWGARVEPDIIVVGESDDSDNDGLSNDEEKKLGTDPYDPDSDKDKLSDGDEVLVYKTDPLNPDTDWDLLNDGAEVMEHRTNPLVSDTDNGGVSDGHEVLEDSTDPLNPADDLQLFELYIQFDYDKAVIKPEFFGDLNKIAKVLSRSPESTAKIEGHADKTLKSGKAHNMKLSQQRANSVLNYLENTGIEKKRMKAIGYGFSRPKAPNDPKTGNPLNRRVDVYIKGSMDDVADQPLEKGDTIPIKDAADK